MAAADVVDGCVDSGRRHVEYARRCERAARTQDLDRFGATEDLPTYTSKPAEAAIEQGAVS